MRHIAIIGLGFVSDLYMSSFATFPDLHVKSVCDRDPLRRDRFVAYWADQIGRASVTPDIDELIAVLSPGDVVLNLTNPSEHYGVTHALLEAGMHVWSEKPLAMDMDQARALHALAEAKGLILASAPASVLSEAAQTLWAAIRAGVGGKPRLVYAELDDGFIPQAPTEAWISASGAPWPSEDEYRVGCTLEHAGYWLSWLIAIFGPVRTVVSASSSLIPNKLPGTETAAPDYSSGTLFFENGIVARLTCSILAPHDHRMRVICDGGDLEIGAAWDNAAPVRFRPRFRVRRRLMESPFASRQRLCSTHTHPKVKRVGAASMNFALGPVEMLDALANERPCRLGGDYALHLTEVSLALQNGGEDGGTQRMTTRCGQMEPMPWAELR